MSRTASLKRMIRAFGYDLSRYDPAFHALARRGRFLQARQIDVVLDVGANTGQFALQLRQELGYRGRIVSFEPLRSAYEALHRNAAGDSRWHTVHHGLGDTSGHGLINVAGNSRSSSLLAMLPVHSDVDPASRYVDTETIELKTLDSVFSQYCGASDRIYLKVDTQGFEERVIEGAKDSLARIEVIQLEMSLIPLYEDQPLFEELLALLTRQGYRMVALDAAFADPTTGQVLQVDGVFGRPAP